jgi:ATP-dependent helicase/DNAse subunit B
VREIWLAPILSNNRERLLERAADVLATGPAEGLLYLAASRPLLELAAGRLLDGVRCRGVWNTLPVFLFRGLVRHTIATAIDDETGLPLAPRIPIDRDELPLKRSLISQVMLRLLGEGILKALEPLANREGCVNSIAKLIGEIQRAARTPGEFASVVEARARDFYHTSDAPEAPSAIPRQLDFDRELALIYASYQASLDRFHLSEDDADQLRALGVLRGELNGMRVSAPWLSGVRLLVLDGFFDFTPAQGEMLRLLIPPVADVIINLGRDQRNPEIFRPFFSTIEQLNSIADFETIITTEALPVAASLAPLREHLFNPSARPGLSTPVTSGLDDGEHARNITFLECSNRQTEIRAIAKRIKRLVLVEGVALADIALVVRELAAYSETITRVLDEESIPSSLDHRIQLSEVSSVRAAMKLFDLLMELGRAGEQLKVSALAGVMKSGYLRLSENDLDALRREDGRRTTGDGPDWEDGRRSSVDGRAWDADQLENVIAFVGGELRIDRWLKRARQLTPRSPERDTDVTDEESESDDDNMAAITPQPDLQNRRVQQAEPVDVPLPGSDRRLKPAREIDPALIAWSALVVERFAQIITAAPREASPRALRDWVMRTLDQLQFASVVKGTDQSAVEESDLPRLTLDLRGLEGLRLAFATAVRSIESSERVVNDTEAPSAIKLTTLLEEAMRCVRAQSLAISRADPDGLNVLGATDVRGLRFRTVFVAGLVEGGFPLRPARDWIYPHEERERLKHYGLTLEDISPDTLLKEEHYFYQAACRATDRLFLSRPLVLEDGSETVASYYIEEVSRAIAPSRLKKETVRDDFDGRTLFESSRPSELRTLLVRQQERRRHRAQSDGNYPAEVIERLLSTVRARGYLSESIERRIAIEHERGSERFGNFDGIIVDSRLIETLRERYGAGHFFSASELSLYGKCPFKFFAEKVLKLEPRGEAALDLTALDAGSLLHEALRRFFELHRGERLTGFDRLELRRQLGEVADAVFDEHQRAVPPLNARVWEIDREIRKLLLEQVLDYELSIQEQTASTGLRPAYFELAFGMPGGEVDRESIDRLLDLRRTSEDKSEIVRIRGQIDRVDVAEDGTAIAYDYKLSRGASVEDMQEGRALQLHIYLSALEQLFLPGRPIAGGGYYTMKGGQARRNQGLYRAALEVYTRINRRTASMLNDSEWKRIRDEMQERIWEFIDGMRAGQFQVEPSAPESSCPHCDYSAVCRYEKFRIQRKDR